MSAPPDSCQPNRSCANTRKMSGQNHQEQAHQPQHNEQGSNVRHIPIFVEGRDEPVINKSVDHGAHFGETKPAYVPPPQPHIDREQYFADDSPGFHHPPNFTRAFGTPFNKGFRQGPQPFVQQKVYPQAAFARGASPQRSQSPKPQAHPDDHYKVPVHHEHATPKTEPPSRAQQKQQQHAPPPQHAPPQHAPPQHAPPQQQTPQKEQTPPPKPQQNSANDPITQILSIQTDVLNLMSEVENFTGTKKDKKYMFLDEMLTRNLIKLDNIETDGKENIRQARKEAIRCIQKCIAVLEAKADNKGAGTSQPQTQDVEMNSENGPEAAEQVTENGEVEMKEASENVEKVEPQTQPEQQPQAEKVEPVEVPKVEPKPQETTETAANEIKEPTEAADTRPEEKVSEPAEVKSEEQKQNVENKPSPKKGTKTVKKRDKSKDKDAPKDSNKEEKEEKVEKTEEMQVDDKGDKTEPQVMEIDSVASQ